MPPQGKRMPRVLGTEGTALWPAHGVVATGEKVTS